MTPLTIILLVPVACAAALFLGALFMLCFLAFGETKRPTDQGDE